MLSDTVRIFHGESTKATGWGIRAKIVSEVLGVDLSSSATYPSHSIFLLGQGSCQQSSAAHLVLVVLLVVRRRRET